jgi:signal transduction histidine kinase
MANGKPREPAPKTWPIVRSAIVDGTPTVKRLVRRVAVFWVLAVGLQIWDSRNATGAAGVAEFFSALLGICGIGLLGIAFTLHVSMKEAADRPQADDAGVARVLLALPTIGFLAGIALGIAALLMVVRAALGAELWFAAMGAVLYAGMAVVAARTVTHSAQTLFHVGTLHATRAAEYRSAATAARLDALQARMNPHVLFNALNTVASLVRSSPPAAERVVHTLADVLKQTLDRSSDVDGTVAEEIAYVRSCLALESERWGEDLRVSWSIAEDVLAWPMPPFIIQPLVENALRHGLGSRIDGGHIRIAVERAGDALLASVEDDGGGFPSHWRERNGLGNLRQRLQTLYGTDASLSIDAASPSGSRVTVRLPRRSPITAIKTEATHASTDR